MAIIVYQPVSRADYAAPRSRCEVCLPLGSDLARGFAKDLNQLHEAGLQHGRTGARGGDGLVGVVDGDTIAVELRHATLLAFVGTR